MVAPARVAARISLLLPLLCLGCAAKYEVTISSIRSTGADRADMAKSYVLLPGEERVKPDDLQFQEYSSYVERVLADKGYVRTDDAREAGMAVSLYYDLDSSQHSYAYTTPVYGQTGGGSTTFSANSYGASGNS